MTNEERQKRLQAIVAAAVGRFIASLRANEQRSALTTHLETVVKFPSLAYSTRTALVRRVTAFRAQRLRFYFGQGVFVPEPCGDEDPVSASIDLLRQDEARIAAGAVEQIRQGKPLPEGFTLEEGERAELRGFFAGGGTMILRAD